jgi:hypothetical protein
MAAARRAPKVRRTGVARRGTEVRRTGAGG